MERFDGHRGDRYKGAWGGVTCDSLQGVMKGIRKACQLIKRFDGYVGGGKGCGEV